MIQRYSPLNIHAQFYTRCATRSWRRWDRENHICQGILAFPTYPMPLTKLSSYFHFLAPLDRRVREKIHRCVSLILACPGNLVASRSFPCSLRSATITQPHLGLRFTLYPSPPTLAQSYSMSGILPAKKSLVVFAMATTSRASVASSCLTSQPASPIRTFPTGIAILNVSVKIFLLCSAETRSTSR